MQKITCLASDSTYEPALSRAEPEFPSYLIRVVSSSAIVSAGTPKVCGNLHILVSENSTSLEMLTPRSWSDV